MQCSLRPSFRIAFALAFCYGIACSAQITPPPAPSQPQQSLPDAPALHQRTAEEVREAARLAKLATVNGRPYNPATLHDQFHDYLRDSYGPPAFARTTVRTLYNE